MNKPPELKTGRWSVEDDILLGDMVKQGLSNTDIGKRLKRSRCAVAGRLHRVGLTCRQQPSKPRGLG